MLVKEKVASGTEWPPGITKEVKQKMARLATSDALFMSSKLKKKLLSG
jgi:hypothetical protein